jgi:hypothetical protein
MQDAEARTALQAKYDAVFDSFGEAAPRPTANADVADYRYDLMRLAKQKLGKQDERPVEPGSTATVGQIASTPLRNMSEPALDAWEPMVIAAAQVQAETPHVSTLPPAGQFVARHRMDDSTGSRKTEFYGRRSFIADLSPPARRIARIQDPATGRVLVGPAYQRMPGY